jgi:hypothetical protein
MTPTTTAVAKVALAVVTLVLLISQVGFIIVPLLMPAHIWAARTSSRLGRVLWTLLPSLGLAFLAWATIYVSVGEAKPTIWLVPVLALVAAWAALVRFTGLSQA